MTSPRLRVVIADDERPARSYLAAMLRNIGGVDIAGEAANGAEAIQLIERERPDVALLDLQMPEIDGLNVVRLLKRRYLPLVIFVTAYDEYATKAFELNALDYLTKPVAEARLRQALGRAIDRLERREVPGSASRSLDLALKAYERSVPPVLLERIPVRHKQDILLLPVAQVAAVIADREVLHVTTLRQEKYVITYRLKDLEARLDPGRFVRLNRGAVVNIDAIQRVTPLPGGSYAVKLINGQEIDASRIQSKLLRNRLLQL